MVILKINKYPDKILAAPTEPIKKIDANLIKLTDSMLETMYFFGGVGLAANQVGEPIQLFVFDIKPDGECRPVVLFNPKILSTTGKSILAEGCLSFPGITAKIKRFSKILVVGITPTEKEVKLELSGMAARVAQHEIDHLNGVSFIDRVNPLRKWTLKKEYFKVNKIPEKILKADKK